MVKRKTTITVSDSAEGTGETKETIETQFTPESAFRATLGLQNLETDEEIVLVDPVANKYFQLNATGRYVWWLVVQRLSLGEIAAQLAQRFTLSSERAFMEVSTFVQELVERGLAVPVNQPEGQVIVKQNRSKS